MRAIGPFEVVKLAQPARSCSWAQLAQQRVPAGVSAPHVKHMRGRLSAGSETERPAGAWLRTQGRPGWEWRCWHPLSGHALSCAVKRPALRAARSPLRGLYYTSQTMV
jgi:hypothetical protein